MSKDWIENEILPSGFTELPEVSLSVVPSVAAIGEEVKVSIHSSHSFDPDSALVLELDAGDDFRHSLPLEPREQETQFTVPEVPLGDYHLVLRLGDWVLDSFPFEIAEPEYAKQATAFMRGLELRVDATKALTEGNYDLAARLTTQVEDLYIQANSMQIAARAWKDLGSALLTAHHAQRALEAFNRAYSLYGTVSDGGGQASVLLLAGEASSRIGNLVEAEELLDRARSLADSCNADSIAFRSRAALWRLSRGRDEALRIRYGRDLIQTSFAIRSNAIRNEALTLYREFVPGILLNNLWSFHQGYLSPDSMKFECLVSPRLMASQPGRKSSLGNLVEEVSTPWESVLAVFTSTLLTQIIISLSRFSLQTNVGDFKFKVITHRDIERESFFLSIAHCSDRELLLESINRYISNDADFQYYEQLASTVGASLIGRTNQSDFITMEMPRTLLGREGLIQEPLGEVENALLPEIWKTSFFHRVPENRDTNPKRVLVVADDKWFAREVEEVLSDQFELLHIIENEEELLNATHHFAPDVILFAISMPLLTGFQAVRRIKENYTDAKIICVTMRHNERLLAEAFRSGAVGYVPKYAAPQELVNAILTVARDLIYISPLVMQVSAEPVTKRLTPRERAVLELLSEGKTMKEIASRLKISRRTVESQRNKLMQAFGVKTAAELIRHWQQLELPSP